MLCQGGANEILKEFPRLSIMAGERHALTGLSFTCLAAGSLHSWRDP